MRGRESTASIDDLLGYDEEPDEPRRAPVSVGWLLRATLVAGALTAVTVLGLRLLGFGVPPVGAFAGFLALLLIRRVAAPLQPPPARRPTRRRIKRGGELDWGSGQDGVRIAIRDWEQRLSWAEATRGSFANLILQPLRELTDERLRQRHGITRASEPDRARALLGEPLCTFLEGRSGRPSTAAEYAAIVSELEKL